MKNIKTFEGFINENYESIKSPDELKGLIVKKIWYEENGIVKTDKGTFDVGCMGGAMISIEGDLDYRSVNNMKIVDAIIDEYSLTLVFDEGEVCFVDDTGGEGVGAGWIDDISERFGKRFNESNDSKIEEIELKIQDAAYSLKTFGTMTKQASFINGAKWAIHNLTDEEIKHLRENSDPDDHSFFGL
jgi:hypothetical protein